MLDGVEPGITEEIRHAAAHVPAIERVIDVKTRWLGHQLHADVAIDVDRSLSLAAAGEIANTLRRELLAHLPALRTANITFGVPDALASPVPAGATSGHGHHHVREPAAHAYHH
jgi:divalent metal cation (Fe/Co/Zn/Cd) transporter